VKRARITRILGRMERLRLQCHGPVSPSTRERLTSRYDRLWDAIRPYCTGERPCSDDPPRPHHG